MGLIGQEHDVGFSGDKFIQGHARITRIAPRDAFGRERRREAEISGERIPSFPIGEDILSANKIHHVGDKRRLMDGHERIHPDGHKRANRRRFASFFFCASVDVVSLFHEMPGVKIVGEAKRDGEAGCVSDAFDDAFGKRNEHAQACGVEAFDLGAGVFFLVGDDEIGLKLDHAFDVYVFGAADDLDRLDLPFGLKTILRASDEGALGAEADDRVRVAGHERDDAFGRFGEHVLALPVVAKLDELHRGEV